MTEVEFLLWVRGPAFNAALFIMLAGIVVRLLQILFLGRKANLAEGRGSEAAGGFRTILSRQLAPADTLRRSAFTIIAGYVFHIGLFVVIFLFVPHILVFERLLGISWAGLPTNIIDASWLALADSMEYWLIKRNSLSQNT